MTAACGGFGPERDVNAITVWTLENLPERLAVQQAIAAEFSRTTGVAVEVVGIDEDQFNQLVMSAAASGKLPDVVGALSLAGVRSLAANELLDTEVPGSVVANLGTSTFSERALTLTRDGTTQLAVPSDAFAQLLLYRRDLFAAARLPEPQSYADITTAARALNTGGVAGFVGSTTPGDGFTQQTFEHLALANGCELVSAGDEISLDSPSCITSFAFYNNLIRNYSVAGAQDSDTPRLRSRRPAGLGPASRAVCWLINRCGSHGMIAVLGGSAIFAQQQGDCVAVGRGEGAVCGVSQCGAKGAHVQVDHRFDQVGQHGDRAAALSPAQHAQAEADERGGPPQQAQRHVQHTPAHPTGSAGEVVLRKNKRATRVLGQQQP